MAKHYTLKFYLIKGLNQFINLIRLLPPVDEILGDEGWQEGEGVVGRDEGESVSGVHGIVGEEVVLLEEQRVQGVDNLVSE